MIQLLRQKFLAWRSASGPRFLAMWFWKIIFLSLSFYICKSGEMVPTRMVVVSFKLQCSWKTSCECMSWFRPEWGVRHRRHCEELPCGLSFISCSVTTAMLLSKAVQLKDRHNLHGHGRVWPLWYGVWVCVCVWPWWPRTVKKNSIPLYTGF